MSEKEEAAEQEAERAKTRYQEKIDELSRRNKELERLVNMDSRMQESANLTRQTAQAVGQIAQKLSQPAEDKNDQWTPFLRPKMDPILREVLTPYQNALMQMADKTDKLETMLEFPEYKDPEIQREVETVREQRRQQSGVIEPRSNILTFLRGRDPDKYAGKKPAAVEDSEIRRNEAGQVHVENQTTRSTPEPKGKVLNLDTASAADIEKWAAETGVGNQLI